MNMLEERLRTGLASEADAWPDPPAPGTARRRAPVSGWGVSLIAAAAVIVVIGGVAVADRLGTSDATQFGIGSAGDEPTASVAPASTAVPIPNADQLPRFTLDLPGWSIIKVVDFGSGTAGYFGQRSDTIGAVITVWADKPGDAAGTGYEHALTALSDGEPLGTVEAVDGVSAVAFHHSDDGRADYTFLWQHTDSISVEVFAYTDDFDGAKSIVAAIAPITEDAWIDMTDGYHEEGSATPSTTTLAPVADLSEATVEHTVTLSDGTEVTMSLLVAAGSELSAVWSASLDRGAYDKPYEWAPFSSIVTIFFNKSVEDVRREAEEVERLSGMPLLKDTVLAQHGDHTAHFQFGRSEVPEEILTQWLDALVIDDRTDPDQPLFHVGVGDDYKVTYGPSYSIQGTYVDGEPVVVAVTEGCEVEPGAPVEHSNWDNAGRASVTSCELDGRVEVHVSGSIQYIERLRGSEVVRITR